MASLFIVATPIGNLEDITLRALRILKEADLVLAEDTRVTGNLFARYDIKTPLESFHQHSDQKKIAKVISILREGKNIAFVSDAGTPGIQDPGQRLIDEITKQLPNVAITAVPGPSALTAALSIAGFNTDKFLFLGFPPHKKGRNKFFREIREAKHPVVFFESPHRIIRALKELGDLDREIVVARELTKKFETIYRGTAPKILSEIGAKEQKGEFVIVVNLI